MSSSVLNLSSLISPLLSTTMDGVGIKQISRTFSGNYKLNFPLCFQHNNDSKTLNFSNFYLTSEKLLEDICDVSHQPFKSNTILTKIRYANEYLRFLNIDPTPYIIAKRYKESSNYGIGGFDSNVGDNFYISFLDFNKCHIYFRKNEDNYYLVSDIDQKIIFVKETLLDFNTSTINPQDFTYLFSEENNSMLLFKKTSTQTYILVKNYSELVLKPNIVDYFEIPFEIDRNIYTYPNISFNTSFITYDNINNIDNDKSKFDLTNNFLMHKKITTPNTIDIITLKNQLTQLDVFSCSNNLLSSENKPLHIDEFREYTNIFQDISEERTNDLKLNYVFYNKAYNITPGKNIILSPQTLYPFSKLNINDTKFIEAGAFSFISPEYSDKIFALSENTNALNNGQTLLCTWLSGNPKSNEKIWVDRYYYPDLIDKESALTSTPMYSSTYDDYLESLIMSNSDIKTAISNIKFFDKLSDFAFEADKQYEYHRVNTIPETIIPISPPCETTLYPDNYFKDINNTGEFTLSFYFNGTSNDNWSIKSNRNNINAELVIDKTENTIYFSYSLYDSSTNSYILKEVSSNIVTTKYNIFCVSVNALTGIGYVFLNSQIIFEFTIDKFNFLRKQLLFGDFFLFHNNTKQKILNYSSDMIKNVVVSTNYLEPEYLYMLASLTNAKIDPICITLPCGMCNSVDDIGILNNICDSTAFKSNNVNVIVKNIDERIDKNNLKQYLIDNLENVLPVNVNLNDITYNNYKNLVDLPLLNIYYNGIPLTYNGIPIIYS